MRRVEAVGWGGVVGGAEEIVASSATMNYPDKIESSSECSSEDFTLDK